jgi:hypothetical protein
MVRDRPFARFLPVESLLRRLGFSDYVHPGSLLVKATWRAGYRRSNVLQERKGCRSNHIGLAPPRQTTVQKHEVLHRQVLACFIFRF